MNTEGATQTSEYMRQIVMIKIGDPYGFKPFAVF